MRPNRHSGFTIIELMATIAIAAILLTLAYPSFSDAMQSNRVASATNNLLATLAYARSESLRTRSLSTVCSRTDDGENCGVGWTNGILVWTDENRNNALEKDEIRRILTPPRGIQIVGIGFGYGKLSFDARGRLSHWWATHTFVVTPLVCKKGALNVRTITIAKSGRTDVQRSACS
ncbi:GspH/FimT family pseudopilin [Pseudomonas sp. CGJS7]|uniref:GspH/FimT family pseudopilin n=1 Tax=Pseudomonas sp. CGJS7 TaxID=3109348 RepID=UPI00300B962E